MRKYFDFDLSDISSIKKETICDINELNGVISNAEELIILHVNVRSIDKNFELLNILIEKMNSKPNIIVCSETWKINSLSLYKIEGYNAFYNQSYLNKADGVLMYVEDNINATVSIEEVNSLKILNATIKGDNDDMIKISGIYRSHKIPKLEFINCMNEFIINNKLLKNHYIIGDFNVDTLNTDHESESYLNNFLQNKYVPKFFTITRSNDSGGGSCIDNAFEKSADIESTAYKLNYKLTDHNPLVITMKFKSVNLPQDQNTKNVINYKKLIKTLKKSNWQALFHQNPELYMNNLIEHITTSIQLSTSVKKDKNNGKRKTWITKGLMTSSEIKNKLYKDWQRSPSNTVLKTKYTKYSNKLSSLIKIAKNSFDTNEVCKIKNDSKKLWNFINNKIGKGRKKRESIEVINYENIIANSSGDIANMFNGYFAEIGEKLAKKIPVNPYDDPTSNCVRCSSTFFLKPTCDVEVQNIINKLKNKTGGVDKVHAITLKKISNSIKKPLAEVINMCFEKGIWPTVLKTAEILPIFKKGIKTDPSNYRPISLVSNFAKIFEKILYNRLFEFFIKNKIIAVNQFGFLKGYGTKDAMNYLVDYAYKNLDASCPTIGVFLDMSKAFDTVNHNILINKLEKYGIRGLAHNLIKCYLSNRQQYVCVNGFKSEMRTVKCGVPQGTILGPLLFLIYVNDLLSILPSSNIVAFADDTSIICADKSWAETANTMNLYLEKIAKWLITNQLTLNVNKSVFLTFANHNDMLPDQIVIKIGDNKLQRVENTKYLGITIDQNLKWNLHIQNVTNKLRYLLFIFAKLKKILSINTMLTIYYGLFNSLATYGIEVWGSAYESALKPLVDLQRRIIKIITNSSDHHILSIHQNYRLKILLHQYENLKNETIKSNSITRNKNIIKPKARLEVGKKRMLFNAIDFFNNLPNHLKTLTSGKNTIKGKLKKWILEDPT